MQTIIWIFRCIQYCLFLKTESIYTPIDAYKKYIVRKVNIAFRARLLKTESLHKRFIPVVK